MDSLQHAKEIKAQTSGDEPQVGGLGYEEALDQPLEEVLTSVLLGESGELELSSSREKHM